MSIQVAPTSIEFWQGFNQSSPQHTASSLPASYAVTGTTPATGNKTCSAHIPLGAYPDSTTVLALHVKGTAMRSGSTATYLAVYLSQNGANPEFSSYRQTLQGSMASGTTYPFDVVIPVNQTIAELKSANLMASDGTAGTTLLVGRQSVTTSWPDSVTYTLQESWIEVDAAPPPAGCFWQDLQGVTEDCT